jgi:hypothetical protein
MLFGYHRDQFLSRARGWPCINLVLEASWYFPFPCYQLWPISHAIPLEIIEIMSSPEPEG